MFYLNKAAAGGCGVKWENDFLAGATRTDRGSSSSNSGGNGALERQLKGSRASSPVSSVALPLTWKTGLVDQKRKHTGQGQFSEKCKKELHRKDRLRGGPMEIWKAGGILKGSREFTHGSKTRKLGGSFPFHRRPCRFRHGWLVG